MLQTKFYCLGFVRRRSVAAAGTLYFREGEDTVQRRIGNRRVLHSTAQGPSPGESRATTCKNDWKKHQALRLGVTISTNTVSTDAKQPLLYATCRDTDGIA